MCLFPLQQNRFVQQFYNANAQEKTGFPNHSRRIWRVMLFHTLMTKMCTFLPSYNVISLTNLAESA